MPKSNSPPKYRHYRPRNLAVVRIAGKDHYLGPYGSPESREKYARLIAELAGSTLPAAPRTDVTVTELVARYWEWAATYYTKNGRPTGQLPKLQQSMRVLRELYGGIPATAFGPLAMRAIQQHCSKSGKCRNYVNAICGEIRRLFKWAASHELLPASIYEALRTVPGLQRGRCQARETEPVRPVTEREVEATLPHLSPVVADMVRFQALVGCRPTEVCLVRPADVDTMGEVWVYVPAEHKTEHHGRERRIFIGPKAQDILRPYLLRPADSYCFSPVDSERKRHEAMRERRKSKVQPSQLDRSKAKPKRQPRQRYTKDSFNRAIRRACEKAGVPVWRPNQLRHAVATAIRRTHGIEAAQTVLGHSRADVTQVYAERDWSKAADVMMAIG